MDTTLRLESQRLAEEVYALIQTLDPATWRAELEEAAQEKLDHIKARAREILAEFERRRDEGDMPGLEDALARLAEVADDVSARIASARREMAARAAAASLTVSNRAELARQEFASRADAARAEWRATFRRLQPAYADLAGRLRSIEIAVPNVRPTNVKRSLFHMMSGVIAFFCIQHVMNRTGLIITAASFAGLATFLETGRRISPRMNDWIMRGLGPIAHAHEWSRVNSATWYAFALLILAVGMPDLMAAAVAVLVLGLADPAAATVGRRYGRIRLVNGRSLIGTLTFAAVATLAGFAVVLGYAEAITAGQAATIAAIGGVVGALAELFTRRLDDNFTIPVAVGFSTYVAMLLVV